MTLTFDFNTDKELDPQEFYQFLGIDNLMTDELENENGYPVYMFYRPKLSTTTFIIDQKQEDCYTLIFDTLASVDDYKFLPYLLDTLSMYLTGEPYEIEVIPEYIQLQLPPLTAYQFYEDEWMKYQIGESIAYAKCVMSLHLPFYIDQPINKFYYLTESILNKYGVDIHSSTPRIYGYIQYLLRNNALPYTEITEMLDPEEVGEKNVQVDVPQHISIGTVKSWHTDGSVTEESFCAQDVALLINIGQRYQAGAHVDGVVLNDLGTIYQEGLGVDKDVDTALEWYKEAIKSGDRWYAPSNIGDIYRKGWSTEGVQLKKAAKAYKIGLDPYAQYRVGQSYEEGWTGKPNMSKAMYWYKKAAKKGHYLALERLEQEEEE